MSPPSQQKSFGITQQRILRNRNLFGMDKFYALIKEIYEYHPSRRQIADFFKSREANQLYAPAKARQRIYYDSIGDYLYFRCI